MRYMMAISTWLQPWEYDPKLIPDTIYIKGERFVFAGFPYKSKPPAEAGLKIVREQGYNARLKVYALSGRKKLYAVYRGKKHPIPKSGQPTKPKFGIGDEVYSYQNPRKSAPIAIIIKSDDPKYEHSYVLQLPGRRSKYMGEKSLRKRPIPRGREYS